LARRRAALKTETPEEMTQGQENFRTQELKRKKQTVLLEKCYKG
jgi:hypothetical protein